MPLTPWAGPSTIQVDDEDRDFFNGSMVDSPEKTPKFILKVDKNAPNPEDFPICDLHEGPHGQLLFSQKLIDTLARVGVTNFQFFECEVTFERTGERIPYKLVNVLGVEKALDTKLSDCTVDEDGFVEAFETLRIDESKIEDFHLFRLYEAFPLIIISSSVKIALEAAGITGVKIISDSEWEPGMF